jgi:hypothetical protein
LIPCIDCFDGLVACPFCACLCAKNIELRRAMRYRGTIGVYYLFHCVYTVQCTYEVCSSSNETM